MTVADIRLYLVGGFLGSGKTTAIIQAAKNLAAQNILVGIVTNDQGRYLVDTAFIHTNHLPAVEVGGGCFCCHYDDLQERLNELIERAHPAVIFAESVGSCADIIATVLRPMLQLSVGAVRPHSLTVFTDIRMLSRRLQGQPMPFSEDVVYIFDQQIEEAQFLILNKMDLLDGLQAQAVLEQARNRYPQKTIWLQNSLASEGVSAWLAHLQKPALTTLPGLEIDYARYGAGEMRLAWLDQSITLKSAPHKGRDALLTFWGTLCQSLAHEHLAVGHAKCFVQAGSISLKLSHTSLTVPGWEVAVPELPGTDIDLLLNLRVECSPDHLKQILLSALYASGASVEGEIAPFQPGFPQPTHRIIG